MSIRYLTARLAQQIDEELMNASGAFSLDQLMELAGLACAQALATVYPLKGQGQRSSGASGSGSNKRVLVCCGPGNQGGDGLVAARHLSMFGYSPTVFLPKPGSKDIYKQLLKQTQNLSIPTLTTTNELSSALKETDVVLDAIFGFSFSGPVRPPFDDALQLIAEHSNASNEQKNEKKVNVVSVDIPSGWDVENGPTDRDVDHKGDQKDTGSGKDKVPVLMPDVLISLTAPKLGVKAFKGRHFLGGRFVPWNLQEKYELNLPSYPGFDQIVEIPSTDDSEMSQRL